MRELVIFALLLTACGGRVNEESAGPVDATDDPETIAADSSVVRDSAPRDGAATDATVDGSDTSDARDARDTAICDSGLSWTPRCANGIDDDGDGLIDWMDPECTSPLDNDEATFSYGIVDEYYDPCTFDCAFDSNTGGGDDGCYFKGPCIVGNTNPRCPYDPAAAADPTRCPSTPEKCIKYCGAKTPNGCDCTGCCDAFDSTGASKRVRVYGFGCSMDKLNDPTVCPPCEKKTECARPCGRCDHCIGKTTIPSDCTDEMKTACPAGAARCSPDKPCPCGEFCLTGCCIKP